ncbi:MAG: hypothetical protein ABL971_02785 [Vicinamibacterales bacterium]
MTMTLPRRQFFVTAGLGAAGTLAGPLAQLTLAQPAQTLDESVLRHVGKELARLYTVTRSQPMYAEHYQTLAANLRLLALSFPDIRAAARRPRPLHDHGAHARRVEEVRKHLGIDISGEPEPAPLTAAEEARLRTQLAKEGLGPTLLRMADAAQARATQVAKMGGAPQFRNAQSGQWCTLQPAVEVAVTVVCSSYAALLDGAQAAVACAVAQIVIIIWRWVC